MLIHWFQEWVINTLWNKISRKCCMTCRIIVTNFGLVIVNLNNALKCLCIGMLELLVSTVHRFISTLTNVTVLRFHEGDKVTMCQLNHIPLAIWYPWEEDISIIQDIKGIRWTVENITGCCQELFRFLRENVVLVCQETFEIVVIKSKTWLLFFKFS